MKDDQARIKFALAFAQMDLDNLREGDWLNLRDDMMAFLDWGARRKDDITRSGLIELRGEARQAFSDLAGLFTPGQPLMAGRKVATIGTVDTVQLMTKFRERGERGVALGTSKVDLFYFDVTDSGRLRVLVSLGLRDSFFFALLTTLSRLDVTYLRECRSCSRLFYAEDGRQRFCSPRCATREATKRFRQKHRQEENERGKTNHGKRMRKKLGPNVKIKRRTKTDK